MVLMPTGRLLNESLKIHTREAPFQHFRFQSLINDCVYSLPIPSSKPVVCQCSRAGKSHLRKVGCLPLGLQLGFNCCSYAERCPLILIGQAWLQT